MKIDLVKKSVNICMDSNLTAFVQGSPGLGKSAIVKEIAQERGLKLIDVRLTQCDITDLNGLPKLDGKKATFLPFDTFPIAGDDIPEGFNGWLLFLDELNSANKSVQASAYKLILDRMVGNHHLHEKVSIVAAGNLITDNAVVNNLSTALRSRLVNLTLDCDADLWLKWAMKNHIDPSILAYIKYKPVNLFNFNPEKDDETYACPRTWAMLSSVLAHIPLNNLDQFCDLVIGVVGKIGYEFISYAKYVNEIPSIGDIIYKDPAENFKKLDLGKIWLLIFHIKYKLDQVLSEEHFNNLLKYFELQGLEYLTVLIGQIYQDKDAKKRMISTKCFNYYLDKITTFEGDKQ